ncbi:MmpS family transport accessory protein [Mycolicibacterium sp. XJ870]
MTRPYSPYDTTQTERFSDRAHGPGSYPSLPGSEHDAYAADYENYDDFVEDDGIEFYEEPIDRRWIWVAGVAGAILLVAVICTVVILGGGDSGSVSATVASPPQTSQPSTTVPQDATSKPVRPTGPANPSLSPETVTTVTPAPTAPSATAAPIPAAPPAEAAPPPPNPRAITYQVTGNRQLIDLVTIVYTDAQGALQTDINVALPWSKTVVLNPGVELKSVTATSVAGQLNCAITDASGAVVVQQATNSMITTCTQ